MLILIAESKTMCDNQHNVSAKILENHLPAGELQASLIINHLEKLSQSELIADTGLTPTLAAKLKQMIYEFPNKTSGLRAIEAYTGVVFKALRYESLNDAGKKMCERDVRIISSLYGILRPDDIIKPYRLDFTAKASPGGIALNSFWKKDVTIHLVKTIQERGFNEVVNLLPGDAAKCIDWKIVKRFCKVWKVDFVEIVDGGMKKTPSANKLKSMRGELLRQILLEDVSDIAALCKIKSDNYICEGTPVYPDHLQFIC